MLLFRAHHPIASACVRHTLFAAAKGFVCLCLLSTARCNRGGAGRNRDFRSASNSLLVWLVSEPRQKAVYSSVPDHGPGQGSSERIQRNRSLRCE